jgi:arylsulfatase
VSKEYKGRFAFKGGEIAKVVYDIGNDGYVDLELRMAAALARD